MGVLIGIFIAFVVVVMVFGFMLQLLGTLLESAQEATEATVKFIKRDDALEKVGEGVWRFLVGLAWFVILLIMLVSIIIFTNESTSSKELYFSRILYYIIPLSLFLVFSLIIKWKVQLVGMAIKYSPKFREKLFKRSQITTPHIPSVFFEKNSVDKETIGLIEMRQNESKSYVSVA